MGSVPEIDPIKWDEWVARGRELVRSATAIQFELGDMTLRMIKAQPSGFEDRGVHDLLARYAEAIGLAESTLAEYRHVAIRWPQETRTANVSYTVYKILAGLDDRFTRINQYGGAWTVNEAMRAAGQKPKYPVTAQERIDHVRDFLHEDSDAAHVVMDVLRRPQVAEEVMRDPSARHILRTAERRGLGYRLGDEDDRDEDQFERTEAVTTVEGPAQEAPAASPHGPSHQREVDPPREVLELIGVCTTFYSRIQRMLPELHVADYDADTRAMLSDLLEKDRAAADWAETVINTGDTSMDEALATWLGDGSE